MSNIPLSKTGSSECYVDTILGRTGEAEMADYLIMARDDAGMTGDEWIRALIPKGLWGVSSNLGSATAMKTGDRAIFYWTKHRMFVADCTLAGSPEPMPSPAPNALLSGSTKLIRIASAVLWDRPLPYSTVKAQGIRIPFLPSAIFPLNPGQFDQLQALAREHQVTNEEATLHKPEWDHEFAQAVEKHNASVRSALHGQLLNMEPGDFEELVGHLLAAVGFEEVTVTKRSADGGIDVRGVLVVAGSVRTKMAVQVKRWRNNVQAPVVQRVRGSLGAHEQGLIVTTSDFSPGARDEAARVDASPVGLVNGDQLVSLLMEHELGVAKRSYDLFSLKPL